MSLLFLRQQVLPLGRLWGWYPGALAGYPFFELYFPLPFLGMSLLSLVMDPAAAFKLGVLLPALATPLCAYLCARWLGCPSRGRPWRHLWFWASCCARRGTSGAAASTRPWPACSANPGHLCLALLYLGRLPRWLDGRRGLISCALLLWLIGLAHAYALLFCLCAGWYFVLQSRPWTLPARRLLLLYALAFLLWGHWVLPMLAHAPYTEKFNFIWAINSWRDFFPASLLPVIGLGLAGVLLGLLPGESSDRRRAGFLVFWIAVSLLLYMASPLLNTITVRFLPMVYLALTLLAAQALAWLGRRLAASTALALLVLGGAGLWAGLGVAQSPPLAGVEQRRHPGQAPVAGVSRAQ